MNEAEEMMDADAEMPSQCYSEDSVGIQGSEASSQSLQQPRQASCDETPLSFELRRCHSQVTRLSSSTCAECAAAAAAAAAASPVGGTAALFLSAPEQNALTAIDKIQVICIVIGNIQ